MEQVSAAFAAAMASRAMTARLVLPDGSTIQGDPILRAEISAGCNADGQKLTLGSAVAGSIEVLLDRKEVNASLEGQTLQLQLGFPDILPGEWLSMGFYRAAKPQADDDLLTVTALDALGADFEAAYEPLEGFDFGAGVSARGFLAALGARHGVPVAVEDLEERILTGEPPEGVTERQLIGAVAGLYGGFAQIDRTGALCIRGFRDSDIRLTADNYYSGEISAADYGFTVGWLSYYSPVNGQSGTLGDAAARQGVYLENIWVTGENAGAIWDAVGGFAYRPVKNLGFLGDPRIDPGDLLHVTDLQGAEMTVPAMNIRHSFDGGMTTSVTAPGQSVTDGYQGPLSRDIAQKVQAAVNGLTQEQLFNKLTNGGQAQGIYVVDGQIYINASYLKSGVISADLIKAGVLQSADGETFRLDLDKGTFSMKGSGTFGGAGEGDTYIRVDGSELCVYDEQGVPTIRIGQHRSNAMFQLPYIKFFTRRTESSLVDSPGMIFRTPLGLWIGNAEVDMDTLSDTVGVGLTDSSAGIFISTVQDKVYVVSGKQLQNVYTGEAVARFA